VTFYKKLLISMILLTTVPLSLVGMLAVRFVANGYVRTRTVELTASSERKMQTLDAYYCGLYNALMAISSSLEIAGYLNHSADGRMLDELVLDPIYNQRYVEAKVLLQSIRFSESEHIRSLSLIPLKQLPSISVVSESTASRHMVCGQAMDIYRRTVEYGGRFLWSSYAADEIQSYPLFRRCEDQYMFLSCLVYEGANYGPAGVVIMQLNEQYFGDMMDSEQPDDQGLSMILTEDGHIVYHTDKQHIGERLEDEPLNTLLSDSQENLRAVALRYEGRNFLLYLDQSPVNGWRLASFASMEVLPQEALAAASPVTLIVLLTLLSSFLLTVLFSRSMYKPIRQLCDSINRIGKGHLSADLPVTRRDEFGVLYHSLNKFGSRMEQLVRQVEQEQRLKQQAYINALKAQINPHFLYNTLNVMKCLANAGKNQSVAQMAVSLISLLRASIGDSRELIPLRKELKLVNDYLLIQRSRTDLGFACEVDISPEAAETSVQKFILQPLVENCLIHAFSDPDQQDRAITIRAGVAGGLLTVEVLDNGCGMEQQAISELNRLLDENWRHMSFAHVGLANVNARIRLMFGEAYGLSVSPRKEGGLHIMISMPADASLQVPEDWEEEQG
jgi:two-component system sensor histidine kinase YesM